MISSFPASPHRQSGGNNSVKHTVHPGQVTLSINVSPKLMYNEIPANLGTVGWKRIKKMYNCLC